MSIIYLLVNLVWVLVLNLRLATAQGPFIDPDYINQLDQNECSKIFPFTFGTAETGLKIVDWDLQNFQDNYSKFSTGIDGFSVSQEKSFIAACYRNSKGLLCGVTYQLERSFKWVRQITDAHTNGKAAIAISSTVIENAPSTSMLYSNNDSRINLAYESTTLSQVVFVSFNYLTGDIEYIYRINKGVSELASSMILKNTQIVASMDGTTTYTFSGMSLVMSYPSSKKAFDIQFKFQSATQPVPLRVLDYLSKSGASGTQFENTDFSNLLGVSSKSKPKYNFNTLCFYDVCSDITKNPPFNDLWDAVYYMQRKGNNVHGYWLYSATAFMTTQVSAGNTYSNTIWWYATRMFESQQQIAEFKYTFNSDGPLTSKAVSPDAPQLCMTSDAATGSYLHIDDVTRALIQPQYMISNACPMPGNCRCSPITFTVPIGLCPAGCPGTDPTTATTCATYQYRSIAVDLTQSQLAMGLKRYHSSKKVACRAINTQAETVGLNHGAANDQFFYGSLCRVYTTILLEQEDTGTVHLIQVKFRRSSNFNDPLYNTINDGYQYQCDYYHGFHDYFVSTSPILQHSYKLPQQVSGFLLFAKAFVNYGFNYNNGQDVPTTLVNNQDPTSTQQLSFFVAGAKDDQIFFETNNLNLRCQNLLIDSTQDLIIANDPAGSVDNANRADQLSVDGTHPLYRYLPASSTSQFQSAIYSTVSASSVVQILKSVTDPTQELEYDWSVCTQPLTFGLDPKVQKGLLCIEINTNYTLNPINKQGANIYRSGTSVTSMNLNMWPYSNCWDRSSYPFYPAPSITAKPNYYQFLAYFAGYIKNSFIVQQQDPLNTIEIVTTTGSSLTNSDDYLQIQFQSLLPGTLGVQLTDLEMVFKIGADAKNQTWSQQTMLHLSCNPKDFMWQKFSAPRKLPIQVTYYYGSGKLGLNLPPVVPSNLLTNYDVDLRVYLEYDITILFTSNVTGPTTNSLASVTYTYHSFVINQESGEQQWLMLGAIAKSVHPYYYISRTTGRMVEDFIAINLTEIYNVTFVYNVAPSFIDKLADVTVTTNERLVVKLPDIYDPDSSQAYVQQILVFPPAKFWLLQNTKQKTGSYIVLNPNQNTIAGEYYCNVFLIDVSQTPRTSTFGFKIEVLKQKVNTNVTAFVPPLNKTSNISFKPDSNVGIKVDSAFKNATVKLKFNLPMELYINPLFTENSNYTTNVSEVLPLYLKVTHKQFSVYQKEFKLMNQPSFKVIYYDGLHIFILLEFPDPGILSQSAMITTDFIYLKFNQTEVFISQNQRISTESIWEKEFKLPIQTQDTAINMEAAAQQVTKSVTGFMSANFAINLLMSTSLQKMWGNLNVLQLVVATPLLQVSLPQNVLALCEALLSITQFQLFDSSSLTNWMFGQENFAPVTLEPWTDRLSEGGYQQTNFIYNLGSMFYITAALLSFYFIFAVISLIVKIFKLRKLGPFLGFAWSKLTPGLLIRLFFELNFELCISSYLQIKFIWAIKSGIDIFSIILAITSALVCFIMPIASSIMVLKLKSSGLLLQKSMLYKFGALYEMQLVNDPSKYHLLYNVFFMVRRMTTLWCIFKMARIPSFQIGVMMWMTTFWMSYALSVKPFEDPALNRLEVVNEFFYNLILLLSFTFTEFLNDMSAKTETGFVFIGLILTMLAINMGVQIKDTIKLLMLRFKRSWLRYKVRREKWKRLTERSSYYPQSFSHLPGFKNVVEQEFRDQVFKDFFGDLKNDLVGKAQADQQVPADTNDTLVILKTKQGIASKTQNQVQDITTNQEASEPNVNRNYQVGDVVQLSSFRSSQFELSNDFDVDEIIQEFSREEEIKEQTFDQSYGVEQRRISPNQLQLQTSQDMRQQFDRTRNNQLEETNQQPQLRFKINDKNFVPVAGMTLWDYCMLKEAETALKQPQQNQQIHQYEDWQL